MTNRPTTGQPCFMSPLSLSQLLTGGIPSVDLLYQNTHLLVKVSSVAMGLKSLDGSVYHNIQSCYNEENVQGHILFLSK